MVGARPTKTRPDRHVGHLLTAARRHRQMSVESIAVDLRIPPKQLRALEQGDFSVFSAEVYARGAYLRYAQYLGVATPGAERSVSRALSGARRSVPLRIHRPPAWAQRFFTTRWILAGALALIAAGVGGWIMLQVRSFLHLPRLNVTEPVGQVASDAELIVRGQAEPDAQVDINGQAVLLQPDGSFQQLVTLHPGINMLRIQAENAAGRQTTVQRPILWPRRR